jgi:hypothetical protein
LGLRACHRLLFLLRRRRRRQLLFPSRTLLLSGQPLKSQPPLLLLLLLPKLQNSNINSDPHPLSLLRQCSLRRLLRLTESRRPLLQLQLLLLGRIIPMPWVANLTFHLNLN